MTGRYDFRARTKAVHAATESKLEAKKTRKRQLSDANGTARQAKKQKIEKQMRKPAKRTKKSKFEEQEWKPAKEDEEVVDVAGNERFENVDEHEIVSEIEIPLPAVGEISEVQIEIREKTQQVDVEAEVMIPAGEVESKAEVKIPGLTLLEGETVDIETPDISIQDADPLASVKGKDAQEAVQVFEPSLTSYLKSTDAIRATTPDAKVLKRPLRGTMEMTKTSQEQYKKAQVDQEASIKELEEATGSLAMGKYLLDVFAVNKVPLGEPLKHGFRSFLPGMDMASDTPIEDFPWIKLDWAQGKDSQAADAPIVSSASTPHTVSIYMLPDSLSSLEEAVQVYSRTFDHRVQSCPHPSLCPLCRYRGRDGLVASSEELRSDTSSVIVEHGSPSKVSNDLKTLTIIVSSHDEIASKPEQKYETNGIPTGLLLKPSVPAIHSRLVGVSLFRTKGVQLGKVRNLETYHCESFDDFKEQIRITFKDVFNKAGWKFGRILYEKFSLFNRGENILDTENGDSSGMIWKRFVSLLEAGATQEESARGVFGSVDIIVG